MYLLFAFFIICMFDATSIPGILAELYLGYRALKWLLRKQRLNQRYLP